ncbi:MAG TPA: ABC transporter ATP-binding protein, partial [Gammaproteobacteria bacterium]
TWDRVQIINTGQLVLSDSIDGLTRRMQASSITVALRHSPAVEALTAIVGVQGADDLGQGRWRVSYLPGNDPAEALVEQAVKQGWGLYELTPDRLSLEDIFVNLTTTEHHTEEAA